ncbi:MAG: Dyp-type peroxidase [Betaproteobacteria bacterium]
MTHAFINVVIPFDAAHSGAVDEAIRACTDPAQGNRPAQALRKALDDTGIVHFMSVTVVRPLTPPELEDGRPLPPGSVSHLVIELSADGGSARVLDMLAGEPRIGDALRTILQAAHVHFDPDRLGNHLHAHDRRIGAHWGAEALGQVFTGSPGMSVRRILEEEKLAAAVATHIDKAQRNPRWHRASARERLEHVRSRLWLEGWKRAFVPEAAQCLAGDPRNAWRPDLTARNPQLWKAAGEIFHTLLWPLYLPLAALAAALVMLAGWVDGIAIFLFALALAAAWLVWRLRRMEKTDPVEDRTPREDHVERLMRLENFSAQNHLASVSRLKPGWLRRLALRLAFIVVGTGRFVGAPGHLGKNGVIHFARWMRLPDTDQLLFWSNYDNTWDSYVGDFIADAPAGVTAIWSNCVGFPRTRGLYSEGAANRDRLVRWARRQQHPSTLWYSAYPDLTADRIRINAAIRQGIASAASDADVRDWFALCFGSRPRPADALQISQVPTLAFGGLKGLLAAEARVVAFLRGPGECRAWLAAVAENSSYGEALPGQTSAVVVALSATGLKNLGVPQEAMRTFPVAFQQGMRQPWRARALGDEGINAPERWEWGGASARPAHAMLLLYGQDEAALAPLRQRLVSEPERHGVIRTHAVPLLPLLDKQDARDCHEERFQREPFGFADGVSQPVIRGTTRSRTHRNPDDLVAPGELVLGYPDNLERIPPSPSIPDCYDPRHVLPDAGVELDPGKRPPEFSRYEGTGARDLGANGTFLVVRQLEQHVDAFERWLERTLRQLEADGIAAIAASDGKSTVIEWASAAQNQAAAVPLPRPRKHMLPTNWQDGAVRESIKSAIAAKLVGRWKDGTSMVRYPLAPGSSQEPPARPDNDFRLGAEDPRGLGCPFGAHIRRANPRDTRFPGTPEEIATTNRHRILRVGRVYGRRERPDPQDAKKKCKLDGSPKGLLFMCLNADIERQFEFVQKTWLLNRNLHGLQDEPDPFLARGRRHFSFPTATGVVRLEIDEDFVTVRGGGYFFVPGRTVLQYLAQPGP